MQTKQLGTSDIHVTHLCMGTATFGGQADQAASFAMLDACADVGINFIDTANVYPLGAQMSERGQSETVVGQWLKGRRQHFVLATKAGGVMGLSANERGSSKQHLLTALDASLKRLQTDYVDVYQLHYDDFKTPLVETIEAMNQMAISGRIRAWGISNFQAWRLARVIGLCETHQWVKPSLIQPRYNLLFRQIERDLIPLSEAEQLGMICYNPLAGGLLSAKHQFAAKPNDNSRFGQGAAGDMYKDRYWHEREFLAVQQYAQLAKECNIPLVQMAVAWVLANPAVTCAILGASRVEQLPDVFKASDTVLTESVMTRLNEISHEFRRGDASR